MAKGCNAMEVMLVLILLICSPYSLSMARPLEITGGNLGVFESILQGQVPSTGHSGCTSDSNSKNGFCPNPPRVGDDLGVVFESLQQGLVPPMGPLDCTSNPASKGGFCPNPPRG